MKLARLVDPNFHSALDKLIVQDIPAKAAYRLKGVLKTTREELQKYEEFRQELLQKYGRKAEDGTLVLGDNNSVQFDSDNYLKFAKDLAEITNEELDLPTVTVTELGDRCLLTVIDIENLEGLIVGE